MYNATVDHLVNNAGIFSLCMFEDSTNVDDFAPIIVINLPYFSLTCPKINNQYSLFNSARVEDSGFLFLTSILVSSPPQSQYTTNRNKNESKLQLFY